jgi:hypothetical protein
VVPKEKPIPIVEVPIKKRPPEKTPEDLRQILASLTQKKQEVAVVTPDTSVSTSVPVPENPPVQKNESAATPVLEKPNNLKWALAEALQTMQSSLAAAEAPVPQRQSLVTASPQPEARKMEEKNRLSSMVVVPRSAVQSPEENRAFYQSRVRNVVVEHRRQQPAAPVPVTPEKPTAQSNRLDSRSGLDVGKIKRMLGQSDQERSPFK